MLGVKSLVKAMELGYARKKGTAENKLLNEDTVLAIDALVKREINQPYMINFFDKALELLNDRKKAASLKFDNDIVKEMIEK